MTDRWSNATNSITQTARRMRTNDEHMASGAATIIALLALIEAGVVFFCGGMGQLTPRGQSKAAEEAVGRQGPCQAAGSANCGTSSPCRIELEIMIRLANQQKLGQEKKSNVIESVPKHETHPEYLPRPL